VRWPQTFAGSSRAQAAPRGVVVAADTPGIGGSSALRGIHLDPAITPTTFVATALAGPRVDVDRIRVDTPPMPDYAISSSDRAVSRSSRSAHLSDQLLVAA